MLLSRQSYVGERLATRVMGVEVRQCVFDGCSVAAPPDPSNRVVVEECSLVQSSAVNCFLGTAVFRRCKVDGLRTAGWVAANGALFDQVTLQGRIGKLMLKPGALIDSSGAEERYRGAAIAFYENVSWALDVTGARFKEVDLSGVPARLVRRDPRTQFVVTRASAASGAWRGVGLSDDWLPAALELLAASDRDAQVFAVPMGASRRETQRELDDLARLRDVGVAEPD